MPAAQVQKHGLDMSHIDPSLEARLRNIEIELKKRLKASTQSATTDPNAILRIQTPEDVPEAPIAFTLVKTLRIIRAKWTETTVPNLKHYEIQVSKDSGFSSSIQNFERKDTNLTFEADTDDEYFVRVRVVTSEGVSGDFTSTLSTTPGQAVTNQFEDNAITAEAGVTTTSTLTLEDESTDVTVQTLTVTSTGIGAYIFFSLTQVPSSTDVISLTTTLKRGSTTLVTFNHNCSTDVPTLACMAILDTPSAGSVTYNLIVSYTTTLSQDLEVSNRSILVLEAKK